MGTARSGSFFISRRRTHADQRHQRSAIEDLHTYLIAGYEGFVVEEDGDARGDFTSIFSNNWITSVCWREEGDVKEYVRQYLMRIEWWMGRQIGLSSIVHTSRLDMWSTTLPPYCFASFTWGIKILPFLIQAAARKSIEPLGSNASWRANVAFAQKSRTLELDRRLRRLHPNS